MLEVGTGFNGEMTGRENVYLNGAILGMTKAEIDAKMEQIIEFSEVREFIDTPVKRYSSGMYVKLAFSVAAHLDSEIMIMDEVLAVGDMAFQKKCLDRMGVAVGAEGRTVLYVSHNMNTIRQLCTRCIVLDKGKVVFDGDVEKAIEVYMGTFGDAQTHYEYTTIHHAAGRSTDMFTITALDIVDKKSEIKPGSKMRLRLYIYTKKEWESIRFRFEIQYQDGTTAGTMLSEKAVHISEGKSFIDLLLDSTHFTPGRYKADIVAFQTDDYKNEHFVDGVFPGFIIDIIEDSENSTIWLHRYWGHIRLHDIEIL